MNTWEKKFADAIKAELGWELSEVDALIRTARAQNIGPLEPIVNERRHAYTLFIRDFRDEALLAARALFHAANGLHNAIATLPAANVGRKVTNGGRRGADKVNGKRSVDAKRPLIVADVKAYKGEPRIMASTIAKRHGVDPRYVRKIKAELTLP